MASLIDCGLSSKTIEIVNMKILLVETLENVIINQVLFIGPLTLGMIGCIFLFHGVIKASSDHCEGEEEVQYKHSYKHSAL